MYYTTTYSYALSSTSTCYHVLPLPHTTTSYLILPSTTSYSHVVLLLLLLQLLLRRRRRLLLHTTLYYHRQNDKFLHLGQPHLHVGPAILLAYYLYFIALLLHSTCGTAVADAWGWQPEMQKKISGSSGSQPQASATKILYLGRPTLHVSQPFGMSAVAHNIMDRWLERLHAFQTESKIEAVIL